MNLMKMGLLFRHHCTTKVKKTRPHSHLDLRETKTLDQDREHQGEENPQETMATSMEDPMAQRILRLWTKQGEALKRMGGRLTRLEERKLKKPPYVEIHNDEEEDEEWDERDKVEYERNKQFEKIIVETMAMREKMKKMQLAFLKA